MAGEQVFPGFQKDNPRDLELAAYSAKDVLRVPLVSQFLPHGPDGEAQGPFPGPAHVHVPGLVLHVLTDDVTAQAVTGPVAGLIRLDPDDRSPMKGLPLRGEPVLRDPEPSSPFAIPNAPGPKDMEDAVPLVRADLVVLQAVIPELAFDPLPKLLMVVGELVGVAAFCRGEGDPEHLELMAFPKPEQRPDALVAALLFSGPLTGFGIRMELFPTTHSCASFA